MIVRAIVFDIGGVLELTPSTGWIAKWEGRLGLAPGDLEARTRALWSAGSIGAISEEQVHRGLCAALGLSEGALEELLLDAWAEYLGTPNLELIDYLGRLRPRYQTGIISNSFVGAREKERHYGFEALTDCIVYSHEVGLLKPDPRIYLLACEKLGVGAGEVVFVDDREQMVEGARAVGMKAILFGDNAQAIAAIDALLG